MKFYLCIACSLFLHLTLAAGPLNIAPSAKSSASSEVNGNSSCQHINDQIISIHGKGNWLASDKEAWVQLNWDSPQSIAKIVIYNFPTPKGRIIKGSLKFSDGSSIQVDLPKDGTAHAIEFAAKKVDFVRFVADEVTGSNAGLSEIEVFPSTYQYVDAVDWVDHISRPIEVAFFFL